MALLREIPRPLIDGVVNGDYKVFGGVVRNLAGQIVGHLQPTTSILYDTALHGIPKLGSSFSPLSALTSTADLIQNIQILDHLDWLKQAMQVSIGLTGLNTLLSGINVVSSVATLRKLEDIESAIAAVQAFQITASLASGMAMGFGVYNQIMMRKRLGDIEKRIATLHDRFDNLQDDERRRRLSVLTRDIASQVEIADSVPHRHNPGPTAAGVEVNLASLGAALTDLFHERLADLPTDRQAATASMAELDGIAQTLLLNREARLRILLETDEAEAAALIAARHASEARSIAGQVEPVAILARTQGYSLGGKTVADASRDLTLAIATLMSTLQASAHSTFATALLARQIADNGWSSRSYLEEARRPGNPPVMLLASPDQSG